jgi:dephospho-CoA kinase
MNLVALTGGIGSGKSAATNAFLALGVPVIDVDVISHELTSTASPVMSRIASDFGETYITESGALNRGLMRQLVFTDASAREKLNAIVHPAIYQEVLRQIGVNKKNLYQIVAVPLLTESKQYQALVDHVLLIDCDESLQVKRVMERSQLSEAEVMSIMQAQASRQERVMIADSVIVNDGNIQELAEKVRDFHENYINTCIVSQ